MTRRRLRRRYGRSSPAPMLYRFREDYYPAASLISALKREVRAAGGKVHEWIEGSDMFVGISGGPRVDRHRLNTIVFAYSKAKKYYNTTSHRGPKSFEVESELALEDFNRRVRAT